MDYKIKIKIMEGNKGDATYYFNELKINLKRCYEEIIIKDNKITIAKANIKFMFEDNNETYTINQYFY